MPITKVEGGYRWGQHGHVYPDRAGAERQAAAAHASGWTGDQLSDPLLIGAGIILRAPDGRCLFLQRGPDADQPGTWCWPGGATESGEGPDETAIRETAEETGYEHDASLFRADVRGGFTTFLADVDGTFDPMLNDEHADWVWMHPDSPPEPLHTGVAATLENSGLEFWPLHQSEPAMDDHLAFDRASVREIDQDGRLHASLNHISKANICPYLGREIPGWQELGLDPDKIYQMLRDPDELSRPETIKSANNLPLLSEHVPVTSKTYDGHKPHLIVGSLGTDAVWADPYVDNSLVVWAKDHVEGVQSEKKRELSCAYYYRPDMTPGVFKGVRHDGVMRDILFNHCIICEDGRAGDDVVVGDSKETIMKKTVLTRKAAAVQGALTVFLRPMLAQDAQIDVGPLLVGIGPKNWKAKKAALAVGVQKLTEGKLAQDADLEGVHKFLDSLDDVAPSEAEPKPVAEDDDAPLEAGEAREGDEPAGDEEDPTTQVLALLGDKVPAEVLAQIKSILQPPAGDSEDNVELDAPDATANDEDKEDHEDNGGANPGAPAEDEEEDKEMVTTGAMDAAIQAAVGRERKRLQALEAAKAAVRPYVGELVAMDSAEAVYRTALKALKVDGADTIHVSALPALLKMQPLPGSRREARQPVVAMDAARAASYAERFPGADRIVTL